MILVYGGIKNTCEKLKKICNIYFEMIHEGLETGISVGDFSHIFIDKLLLALTKKS